MVTFFDIFDIFYRFPSNYTIIAQVLPKDMEEKLRDKLLSSVKHVQKTVKQLLLDMEDNEEKINQTTLDKLLEEAMPEIFCDGDNIVVAGMLNEFEFNADIVNQFYKFYCSTRLNCVSSKELLRQAVYHYSLSVCDYGSKLMLKRRVREIAVNNYNPFWMLVFNANMDIIIPLDFFGIITYISDYMTKPEKATAEVLKCVKQQQEKANVSHKELMYALINAYLTSREMGECEAYYKLDPNLHYKQSNIRTIFISSGFPEHRQKFLKKMIDDAGQGFQIEGHEGLYRETLSMP